MEWTGHDWCVGTQTAEAGNTWLEPNQIKINTLSSKLFVNSGNLGYLLTQGITLLPLIKLKKKK